MSAADEAAEDPTQSQIVVDRRGRRGHTVAATSIMGRRRRATPPAAIGAVDPAARHQIEGMLGARFLALVAVSGVTFGMTYAQTVQVAKDLGATTLIAGVIVALMAVTMFAVDLVGARAVPRLEGRFGLSGSLLVYGLGALACGLAPNLWIMSIGRLLEGAGCAVFMTLGVQLVIRLSEPRARGHAIGTFNAAWFLGIAVGPPLGGWLSSMPTRWGAQLTFLACSAIAICTAVLLRATMHRYPSPLRPELALPALSKLRGVRIWSAISLGGLGEAVRDGIQMVLIPLAATQLGMDGLGVGLAVGALALTDVVSMRLLGRTSDARGRLPVIVVGSLSGIAVLIAAPLLAAPWALITLCSLMGPSHAAIWVVPPAMVSDLSADREAGLAAYRLSSDVAFGLGSAAAAAVGSWVGGTRALTASATGFAVAIILAASVGESNRYRELD